MRQFLICELLNKWEVDYETILEKLTYEDQISFTETLIKLTRLFKQADYEAMTKLFDEEILKKYGSKLRTAYNLNFWAYYSQRDSILTKKIVTEEEFGNLEIEGLSQDEYMSLLNDMIRYLSVRKMSLYVYLVPEPDNDTLEGLSDHRDKFTTSKQALALHYIFEALEVNDVSYPAKTRLIEFLTGKNYENILKWVKGTKGKIPKNRNADLEFIKPYFEDLKLTKIVDAINNDIDPLEKEMKKFKK